MTDNAISQQERESLSELVLTSDKLTQGEIVRQFEKAWSKWQQCKYSVFVNSGSSADLLLVRAVQHLKSKSESSRWVAQACTWSTSISPIMQNFGSKGALHLCDVNLDNFSPDLNQLEEIFSEQKIEYLMLTHILGFPALSEELLELCDIYNVTLLEDCCEAHGATFKGKKVGNFGVGSTFSFYYGHHMTTLEGGMVCTDDEELYHELLLLRSHGLLRELPPEERELRKVEGVDPAFCFLRDGYNLRGTEINAKLGLMQLTKLDDAIKHRNHILNVFLDFLDSDLYETDFNRIGCSNFALPIFVKDGVNMNTIKETLDRLEIEYRPCIAGNLNMHPLTRNLPKEYTDENVQRIHDRCIYVGNHSDVGIHHVVKIGEALNSIGR